MGTGNESASYSEEPNRSDLISRQDAMSIADDIRDYISVEGYWAWMERLKALPSAEQEKSTTAEKSQLAEEKSTRKLIYLDDAIRTVERFYKVNEDIRRNMAFELRQLPSTQPEQRWIPCEERLPEEEGDYIVTIKVHTIDDDWYPDVNYFRYNPKRKPNGWGTYYEDDIIAWMDKPAPYTQE